jgi:hypothetical protein
MTSRIVKLAVGHAFCERLRISLVVNGFRRSIRYAEVIKGRFLE